MKIKVKEKFVDSISGKKIYANKAENTTNGLNIDDSISSLSSTIKTKQNKLTFAGEDNTITAINSSAIKVDLTDYYKKNETSGKEQISAALETKAYAIARVGGEGPLFGENKKFKFAPEGGTNLNLQEYDSSIDAWTDIGVIVTKENKGPNKILKTDNRNVLQWIDPDYYTKSETSAASEISAALDGKEDKVFVAEYNVTTYQELLDAYNAGKKIICNYYPEKESLPTYVIVLKFNEYSPIQGIFKFSVQTANNAFKYVQCTFNDGDTSNTTWHEETTSIDLSNYYTKDETYNSREIYESLTAKQDLLDYGLYDGTTITAIDSYPVGRQLTAGTDLKITNYNISVDTDGKANGTNSFVAGKSTSALGNYSMAFGYKSEATAVASFAEGIATSAYGVGSHAEGGEVHYGMLSGTIASGTASHSEGVRTSAIGDFSHAEGVGTIAIGAGSHAEGGEVHFETLSGTIANGIASHSEGVSTSAIGDYSHAEGIRTIASDDSSHSEGNGTSAIGRNSHAAGCETIAEDDEMFVCGRANATTSGAAFVVGNGSCSTAEYHGGSDAFIVKWNGVASAKNLQTSDGYVVTDVMLTSATNSTTSFVTNGKADLTPLYTYIKSLEDRIAALEDAQGGFTVNGVQPTVNGNTITVGE